MDKPQNSMLNEKGQTQKTTFYMILLTRNCQKIRIYRDRKQVNGCLRLRVGARTAHKWKQSLFFWVIKMVYN